MIKKHLLIAFIITILVNACTSNQKKDTTNKKAVQDSISKQIQSQLDKIVDDLAPPDTDYTGEFFQKYETGVIKTKGFFRFGKRHGQWFYFYPKGFIWSEAFYDNGKMNGHSKVYSENGKPYAEGEYRQDLSVGLWRYYDTSGAVIKEVTYDSLGKVISEKNILTKKP
ncbi:MAG: toxin-antitoxin system YwqK family antitoxin [Bacteroidia bacterium]